MNDVTADPRHDPREPVTLTIHSLMCPDCGGWESPTLERLAPHAAFLKCSTCDHIVASVRTVES